MSQDQHGLSQLQLTHSTMIQHGWMDSLMGLTSDLPYADGTELPVMNQMETTMNDIDKEFEQEIEQVKENGNCYDVMDWLKISVL